MKAFILVSLLLGGQLAAAYVIPSNIETSKVPSANNPVGEVTKEVELSDEADYYAESFDKRASLDASASAIHDTPIPSDDNAEDELTSSLSPSVESFDWDGSLDLPDVHRRDYSDLYEGGGDADLTYPEPYTGAAPGVRSDDDEDFADYGNEESALDRRFYEEEEEFANLERRDFSDEEEFLNEDDIEDFESLERRDEAELKSIDEDSEFWNAEDEFVKASDYTKRATETTEDIAEQPVSTSLDQWTDSFKDDSGFFDTNDP